MGKKKMHTHTHKENHNWNSNWESSLKIPMTSLDDDLKKKNKKTID